MIVIVHKKDGSWERFRDITKIVERAGWVDLMSGPSRIAILAATSTRLEVFP